VKILVEAVRERATRRAAVLAAGLVGAAAAALVPKVPKPFDQEHTRLALAYHLEGDRGTARAHYEQALEIAPGNLQARQNLAVLLGEIGRADVARREWQRLLIDAEAQGRTEVAAQARAQLR
jgi:Tfp pilus assembly protein PilF